MHYNLTSNRGCNARHATRVASPVCPAPSSGRIRDRQIPGEVNVVICGFIKWDQQPGAKRCGRWRGIMAQVNKSAECVTIAAVGDVSSGHKPPESAFEYVTDALRLAGIRFAQVERLYTERGTYQLASGALKNEVRQPPATAAIFKRVPFSVLSLASNHTGDWGPEAVEDTVNVFRDIGIPTVGAGCDIAQARNHAIVDHNGCRVAFLGYCSVLLPQFWATEERAGAAPMRAHTFYEPYEYQPGAPPRIVTVPHEDDLQALVDDVRRAKAAADLVVVSFHWGLHYTPMPQKYQPVVAHAAIDAGACAILGHHPHQQQGVEIYNGAPIFYALGNFAFHRRGGGHARCAPNGEPFHKDVYSTELEPGQYYDYRRHWNEGGIAYINLDRTGAKEVAYLPTLMNEAGQPQILAENHPQFETTRRYFEWLGSGIKGGVTTVPVKNGRYVFYERKI